MKNVKLLFERITVFDREARSRAAELSPMDAGALSFGVGLLLRLLAPIAPHIAEEIWHRAGGRGLLVSAPWPAALADDAERRSRGGRSKRGSTTPAMEGPRDGRAI